jgi:hypothetical protein
MTVTNGSEFAGERPEDNVVLVAQKGDEIGGGPHEHIVF